MTKDWLTQKYLTEELSIRKVAKLANCSGGTIRYYFKKYNIASRSKSEALSGNKNPMYGKKHTLDTIEKIKHSSMDLSHADVADLIATKGFCLIGGYCGMERPVILECLRCGSLKKIKQAKNACLNNPICRNCKKLYGSGIKYSKDEVVEICLTKKVIFLNKIYNNSIVKHEFKCEHGHIWLDRFSELLRKFARGTNGCRICNYELMKSNIEEIKFCYSEKGFTFLDDYYINSKHKHNVQCNRCDYIWDCAVYSITSLGSGCPKCNNHLNEKLTGKFLKILFPQAVIKPYTLHEKVLNQDLVVKNRFSG